MAMIFLDSHSVVLIDYLEEGRTITEKYYYLLLDQLNSTVKAKLPHLIEKKILFHHDHALAHAFRDVAAQLYGLRFELL